MSQETNTIIECVDRVKFGDNVTKRYTKASKGRHDRQHTKTIFKSGSILTASVVICSLST